MVVLVGDSCHWGHKLFSTCETVSVVFMAQDVFACGRVGPLCPLGILFHLAFADTLSMKPAIHDVAIQLWTKAYELRDNFPIGFIFEHSCDLIVQGSV